MHSPCSLEISRLPEDLNVKKYRRQNIKSGMYYLENPSSIYTAILHTVVRNFTHRIVCSES